MFKFKTKIPLVFDKGSLYSGIAHDGQQTYLSTCDKQVYTLNDTGSLIGQIPTYNNYHTICYDPVLKYLWGASLAQPGVLFRLSEDFKKAESVHLSTQGTEPIHISHVFYVAKEGQIYVTAKNIIYAVGQNGTLEKKFEIKSHIENLEAICAYEHYVLCISRLEHERHLSIYEMSTGILLEEQSLPDNFSIYAMVLLQPPLNPSAISLRILASSENTKDEEPVLIDYLPDLSFFNQYAQNLSPEGIQIQQLYGGRGPFPFSEPNFQGCNPCCPENCQPNCRCCIPCSSQCCADVIESIALAEASIAHILNAEGEKLQKAIACSTDISQLLCINESVLKTIIHCTHLEQTLYYKLETLLNSEFCDCNE